MSDGTIIYISKRCKHCMDLILEIQKREDIKGTLKISSIDDEPFPNIIKNVPSMISNGVLYESSEIFRMLKESKNNNTNETNKTTETTEKTENKDGMINGYCENGSCLGFSPLSEGAQLNEIDGVYSPIDYEGTPLDLGPGKDNYNKSSGIDNEYEKLMKERGELVNNQNLR